MEMLPVTTPTAEAIVKTGSSSDVTSFDDLEDVTSAPKVKSRETGKETVEKDGARKPSEHTEKERKFQEDKRSGRDRKSDAKEAEGKAESDKATSDAQKAKLYRLRKADQELDISDDFEIEVMVNGKPEKVLVKDVVSEFSGKSNWGKKFQELDTERKGFQSEREKFISAAKKLDADLKSGRPEAAIEYIAELAGMNPLEARQAYREQMNSMLEKYSQMEPEEREQMSLKEELEYFRNREATKYATEQNTKVVESVRAHTEQLGSKYGVSMDEMKTAYQEILKDGIKLPDGDQAQAAFVAEYAGAVKASNMVHQVVTQDFQGPREEAVKIQQALLDEWFKDPTLTQSQITQIYKAVYGHKPAARLSQKAKTSGNLRGGTQSPSKTSEVFSFDDL